MTTETEKPESWRDTILAGLANYIDAGSIVAGSVALGFWAKDYGLSDSFVGLIGAFSANAISAGIGALIGGVLCDKFGRKKIYQYDMLFYAFRHAVPDIRGCALDADCGLCSGWSRSGCRHPGVMVSDCRASP